MGDLSIFDRVGGVFLDQSARWRTEVAQATACFHRQDLGHLLHKMKGSCQTIAAMGIAKEFAHAELAMPHLPEPEWLSRYATLDVCLTQLEAEIQTIMRRPEGRAPKPG